MSSMVGKSEETGHLDANDESSGDRCDTEVDRSPERWDIAKRYTVVIGLGRLECLVRAAGYDIAEQLCR